MGSSMDQERPWERAERDDLANKAGIKKLKEAMKAKLVASRHKGRSGWQDTDDCSQEYLSQLLREHVEKGDPVDVANFCMMLHYRGELIASSGRTLADATPKPDLPSEARADGRLAKIMQYIEDIMIEAEVDFPAGREAGPRISYDSDAIEKFLASVLGAPQPPTEARADGVKETVRKALASCEGEQYAFEEWAKKRGLNMEEHPMFYIFTDKTTDHARYAWKACLNYAREHVTPLLGAALTAQDHADVASQGASLPDDMVRLIIAARIVAYGDEADAKTELDKAVEAFADRVPWDEEPDDVASQGGDK